MRKEVIASGAERALSIFSDADNFELAQRTLQALVQSDLVPGAYRGRDKLPNALVAYDLARNMRMPILMVMQNLDIIEGKPAFNSKFKSAALRNAGWQIEYENEDRGPKEVVYETWSGPQGQRVKKENRVQIRDLACRVVGTSPEGKKVLGPWVSISTAVSEGWYTKSGSKWPNMPEVMLAYRAVSWFQNMHAPQLLMGLPTADEVFDTQEPAVATEEADYSFVGDINGVPPQPDGAPASEPATEPDASEAEEWI